MYARMASSIMISISKSLFYKRFNISNLIYSPPIVSLGNVISLTPHLLLYNLINREPMIGKKCEFLKHKSLRQQKFYACISTENLSVIRNLLDIF